MSDARWRFRGAWHFERCVERRNGDVGQLREAQTRMLYSSMNSEDEREGVWVVVHERLLDIARRKSSLDAEEAEWLLAGERERVHTELGYGSYVDYLGSVFGYHQREAKERLSVARRLQELPQTKRVFQQGNLVWSAVRELGRVITPDTEEAWLEAVRDKGMRQSRRW